MSENIDKFSCVYLQTKISIVHGDITNEKVDAIVNAANSSLILGSGVAGAIRKAGGPRIQQECNDYIKINKKVEIGDAAITTSGNLQDKGITYVIHAVGPIWENGESNEDELLRSCVWHSLNKFLDPPHSIETISIPAISSGIFGFPKERCATIIINTILEFIENNQGKLKEIRMVNFDELTVEIFLMKIKEILEKKHHELKDPVPVVKDPEVKDPDVKYPEVKDPDVKDPDVKDPELKDNELKVSELKDHKDSELKDPEMKNSNLKDPEPNSELKGNELKGSELKSYKDSEGKAPEPKANFKDPKMKSPEPKLNTFEDKIVFNEKNNTKKNRDQFFFCCIKCNLI